MPASFIARLAEQGGSRRELARQVAELFFAAEKEGLQRAQKDDFGAILSRLLDELEMPEQVELSNRMADCRKAPCEIVMTMARREIDVAAPVLERSTVLDEEKLLTLADELDEDHRLALSHRDGLTERVTDRLISHEEGPVMRAVACNLTAAISENGFRQLAAHSNSDQALLGALSKRTDMPRDCVLSIFPHLDDERRAKLTGLLNNGGEVVDEMVEKAKSSFLKQRMTGHNQRLETRNLIDEIERGTKGLDEVAHYLAKNNRPKNLAMVFSAISLLPESKALHAILSTNAELLMLMSKALDLTFETFFQSELMRCKMLHISAAERGELEAQYAEVDPEGARRTMRFVNVVAKVS